MASMTAEQWDAARLCWESDRREGYTWLIQALKLPVTATSVRRMAIRKAWSKNALSSETLQSVFQADSAKKVGKYRSQFAVLAKRLCILGITGSEMAAFFDVSETTIDNWKRKYPEFSAAIKEGGMMADANVASRLYQRAIGYTYEAEEIHIVDGQIIRELVVKHCCPDVRAAIFWLTNRQPKLWKHHVETVDKPTIAIVDKEAMNNMYERVLADAEIKRQKLSERAERLGMVIDSGEGD